jgi:hypothetical protein
LKRDYSNGFADFRGAAGAAQGGYFNRAAEAPGLGVSIKKDLILS